MTGDEGTSGQTHGLALRIWRSIVRRPPRPGTEAGRRWLVRNTLALHFRPLSVPRETIRFTHTFGLGGMAVVLFGLLSCTGVLMLFVYEPVPGAAHESVRRMMTAMTFGPLVRGIHFWSANLLVAIVALHMLRVVLSWGFAGARQFNWVLGLGLLLSILASSFTGYLLPWDQLSYWAATIVTGMLAYVPAVGRGLQHMVRGGAGVGGATLTVFYALHTTLIPVIILGLMAFHFWRVRKAGGVVIPRAPGEEIPQRPPQVPFLPDLAIRELAVGLLLTAMVMTLAVAFPPALGQPANPGMSPDPAKAPWYFLGFQELLLHLDPTVAVTVVPLLLLLGLGLMPYLHHREDPAGILGTSRAGRRAILWAAVAGLVGTPLWIAADDLVLRPALPPEWRWLVSLGLAVLLAGVALLAVLRLVQNETAGLVQAAFVLGAAVYLVLTIVGVFFRGSGMALSWPWGG